MSIGRLTPKELAKLVKESNKELIEENFTQPYMGNEVVSARKQKLITYEKFINAPLASLKSMIDQVNSDYTNDYMDKADVQYLIDDQCERLQDAINYTISSLRAIIEKGGLQKYGAGPQYPVMMEEEEK